MLNPREVKINSEIKRVEELLTQIEQKKINLLNLYQNDKPTNLWTDEQASLWLESLLFKMPFSPLYFCASADNQWTVIDGLQRLWTLQRFVLNTKSIQTFSNNSQEIETDSKPLALCDLKFYEHLQGLTFDRLPNPVQRSITQAQVQCHIFAQDMPKSLLKELTQRVNPKAIERLNTNK